MTSVLLLRFAGVLQSWGGQSHFVTRGTDAEPSFSGVIGMILSAQGRRDGPIDDLTSLAMGVRVDRQGVLVKDYQTARGGNDGSRKPIDIALTTRFYLGDAVFLVALEGDRALLGEIREALTWPASQLYLGRRCCAPTFPLVLPDGLREGERLEPVLRSYPWLGAQGRRAVPDELRLVLPADSATGTDTKMGLPLRLLAGEFVSYAPTWSTTTWIATPRWEDA
jgi:CRISPR system Cascade subunit CasD